jgi:enolase
MATISRITGFEILDSRGNPTVAARVVLADDAKRSNCATATASAISARASRGRSPMSMERSRAHSSVTTRRIRRRSTDA